MHSIIVDRSLADDLGRLESESEVLDEQDQLLGAFVPAPGGVPGPEWCDLDSAWSRFSVSPIVGVKLRGLPGEVKVRDPDGRMLGWFVPVLTVADSQ